MTMAEAISSAAEAASAVVAGISPDQLDDSTPCSEYDVRTLGNHLTGFLAYSANAARRGADLDGEPSDMTTGDWGRTFRQLADDLGVAWSEEGALEGETTFGEGVMEAKDAAAVTLMELTVHGWDLARATNQEIHLDPETAALAATVTAGSGPTGRELGFFGPEQTPPADATEFERALAVSGRDPNWS